MNLTEIGLYIKDSTKETIIKNFIDLVREKIKQIDPGINPHLIDNAKMTTLFKHYPEFFTELEKIENLLSIINLEDLLYVSPKELGIHFLKLDPSLCQIPSIQKINLALILAELQVRSSDKSYKYQLTNKGMKYGKVHISIDKYSKEKIYCIKWDLIVLTLITDVLLILLKSNYKTLRFLK